MEAARKSETHKHQYLDHMTREQDRYKIDICGISECKWTESGRIRLATREIIIFSGSKNNYLWEIAIVMFKVMEKTIKKLEPFRERQIRTTFNPMFV